MRNTELAPARRKDVIWRRMGEDGVLLDSTTENYYSLNDVGTRTWELIDGQLTPKEIASQLAEEYDAPPEQIESDLWALLEDLKANELLD